MTFSETLRKNYIDYLLYLDDGGERFKFEEKRVHHEGLIHASALMDCPLKAAKERAKADPVFPELTNRANPSSMHRMQLGVRSAEAFQESLLFGATLTRLNSPFYYSIVEVSTHSDEWKLQGRMDGFVYDAPHGFSHIIEIKHRMPTWSNKNMGQPRLGDVFQLLAYMTIEQADEAHLIILNTPSFKDFHNPEAMMEIWSLVPEDDGFVLRSEHEYNWRDSHNSSTLINVRVLREEIDRQLRYLNGETTPPIDLMSEDAWQCRGTVKRYPKNGNPGLIVPFCPYWCHTAPEVAKNGLEYTTENGVIYEF